MLPHLVRSDESYNGWAVIIVGVDGWQAKWVAKTVVDAPHWKKNTG